MKKTIISFAVLVLIAAVGLTGCGKSDTAKSIRDGANKMLAISDGMAKSIDAGNEADVKESGEQLESSWSSFEDSVKPDYPDQYEAVEQYLDPLVAGSSQSPLDQATLKKLNDGLKQAVEDLLRAVGK